MTEKAQSAETKQTYILFGVAGTSYAVPSHAGPAHGNGGSR